LIISGDLTNLLPDVSAVAIFDIVIVHGGFNRLQKIRINLWNPLCRYAELPPPPSPQNEDLTWMGLIPLTQ